MSRGPAVGDQVELRVEQATTGGECFARSCDPVVSGGKAMLLPLVLPGERVAARVVNARKGQLRAEAEAILEPDAERIEPACRHYGVCGGCHWQHASVARERQLKLDLLGRTLQRAVVELSALQPSGGIRLLASEPWAYRNRIRLAVAADGRLGYRGRRSHAVVAVEECPIAMPQLVAAAHAVEAVLAACPSFPARPNCPVPVTEVELMARSDGGAVMVTLVCAAPSQPVTLDDWLVQIARQLTQITGWQAVADDDGWSPRLLAAAGQQWLDQPIGEESYRVPLGAFFQVNRALAAPLVNAVVGEAQGALAWDLYAGVGLFALPLARRFQRVVAVEPGAASQAGLRVNLEGTCGEAVAMTTEAFLERNRAEREPAAHLVVMDPPRAGLGERVCQLLLAVGAPRMVYVSCDPATLARDLKQLTAERYQVEQVTAVEMFPRTFHMETVVHLRRR